MTDWITDRAPTENDADPDGEIAVRVHPEYDSEEFHHWSLISAGTPWRHTEYWTERDTPTEPSPRRFATIARTIHPSGSYVTIDAIDTDGVAWWMTISDEFQDTNWQRLLPLPADA